MVLAPSPMCMYVCICVLPPPTAPPPPYQFLGCIVGILLLLQGEHLLLQTVPLRRDVALNRCFFLEIISTHQLNFQQLVVPGHIVEIDFGQLSLSALSDGLPLRDIKIELAVMKLKKFERFNQFI